MVNFKYTKCSWHKYGIYISLKVCIVLNNVHGIVHKYGIYMKSVYLTW